MTPEPKQVVRLTRMAERLEREVRDYWEWYEEAQKQWDGLASKSAHLETEAKAKDAAALRVALSDSLPDPQPRGERQFRELNTTELRGLIGAIHLLPDSVSATTARAMLPELEAEDKRRSNLGGLGTAGPSPGVEREGTDG